MLSPHELPLRALSVRQPWAWAIIHAGKNIENRDWHPRSAHRIASPVGSRVCIHASQGMSIGEYHAAADFIEELGFTCPQPHELVRGGIIGTVKISGMVNASDSPWFFGPLGLELSDAQPLAEPIRVEGSLGWFLWRKSELAWPPLLKWMQPKEPKPASPELPYIYKGASR